MSNLTSAQHGRRRAEISRKSSPKPLIALAGLVVVALLMIF
jgi:hypothetical protein